MSNYPPGVTGREYAIAGADYEIDATETCELTGEEEEGVEQGYGYDRWFVCYEHNHTTNLPERDDEDPDAYEKAMDREMEERFY